MNDKKKRLYCLLQKLALSAYLFSLSHCCVIKRAFVEALWSLPVLAYIVHMNWFCGGAEMELRINGKGSRPIMLLSPSVNRGILCRKLIPGFTQRCDQTALKHHLLVKPQE